jgi:protein-disulfide isomerase
VLVEYASMTCPHCAHFHSSVLPTLQKKYIDTGKMRYVLRQFPLNEPALKAAMLLYCVGEQNPDKYYVFAKVLFDAQNKWAFDSNYMAGLETIATVGGLSKEQFLNCTVNTERETAALKRKKESADELKIPHTPFIYIGGEAFDGERTPEAISQFIEKKLTAAPAPQKP